MKAVLAGLGIVLILSVIPGCSHHRSERFVSRTSTLEVPIYPSDVEAEDVKVVAIRDQGTLILDNQSGRDMSGVVVWLNRRWACWVAELPSGTPVHVGLDSFANRHGDRFPVATWLSPDRTLELVLVELYDGPGGAEMPIGDHGEIKGGQRHRAVLTVEPT